MERREPSDINGKGQMASNRETTSEPALPYCRRFTTRRPAFPAWHLAAMPPEPFYWLLEVRSCFSPAYGFHKGFVHPSPRTHGCIRLHGEAAPKFFALVKIGAPVNIASSQPEDATLGPKVQRVDDSKTPDPSPSLMITSAAFEKPSGPLLQ